MDIEAVPSLQSLATVFAHKVVRIIQVVLVVRDGAALGPLRRVTRFALEET